MQITTIWMQEWFSYFNNRYFDGKLPMPRLKVGHSRTQLGSFSYRKKRMLGRVKEFNQTITLSNFYDLSELECKSVLLHEMIHYVIYYTRLKDTSAHGVVFRGMMERLNRDGWEIRVSHRHVPLVRKKALTSQEMVNLVMAVTLNDGSHIVASVNPHYSRSIQRSLSMSPEVRTVEWFVSTDPYFIDKPKVRTPRGFKVSEAKFQELKKNMKAL
jgi:hypothetical protein